MGDHGPMDGTRRTLRGSSRVSDRWAMGVGTKYAAWIYPMYSSVIAHLDVGSQRGNQTEARAEGMPMAEL